MIPIRSDVKKNHTIILMSCNNKSKFNNFDTNFTLIFFKEFLLLYHHHHHPHLNWNYSFIHQYKHFKCKGISCVHMKKLILRQLLDKHNS